MERSGDGTTRRSARGIRLAALALVAMMLASGASACGTMAGDCSGATPDGAGSCIPSDHGPSVAQQAAFTHFGDRAEQVVCFNNGPFRYQGVHFHGYACKAIRGGHLQNDKTYCLLVSRGAAVPDSESATVLAALPNQLQRCTG